MRVDLKILRVMRVRRGSIVSYGWRGSRIHYINTNIAIEDTI